MSGTEAPRLELLELRDVTVRYGEVVADRQVSLTVRAGEVHALVGENGAGKSSLMRALLGLAPLAGGELWFAGQQKAQPSPASMRAAGLQMVHQHFMLVPPLSVAQNVVLGAEPLLPPPASALGLLDQRGAEREVAALSRRLGLAVEPARKVEELSVGEQQRVEILRALRHGARLLCLDEPTAVLTPPEVADLFRVLSALRAAGTGLLLVTHKLDEVQAIADRVTVLRRGEVVARFERAAGEALPLSAIASAMVGGEIEVRSGTSRTGARRDADENADAEVPVLELRGLEVLGKRGGGIDLTLRRGEILGIAGVEGNGQAELCACLVGTRRPIRGSLWIDGRDLTRASPRARRRAGLGYVPEDRHRLGLLLDRSIADNLLLGREEAFVQPGLAGMLGFIDRPRLVADAAALLERLDVRPADPLARVGALSGGNQQKVVLARELARAPSLLLAAQPTRGVDLAAVARIHRELDGVRRRGGAVLLISAELDELLELSDRIAVLLRGRLLPALPRAEASVARLGALMTGAGGSPGGAEAA